MTTTKTTKKNAAPTDPYADNDRWEQAITTDEFGETSSYGPMFNRGRAAAIIADLNSGDEILVTQARAALKEHADTVLIYSHNGSI